LRSVGLDGVIAIQMVGTCATDQQVFALSADQDVAAGPTVEHEFLGNAEAGAEIVVEIRTDQALDADQGIAFRFPP
jgi:hypothetical protein